MTRYKAGMRRIGSHQSTIGEHRRELEVPYQTVIGQLRYRALDGRTAVMEPIFEVQAG
jgi:hypothetical protein